MSKLRSTRIIAKNYFTDRLWCSDAVIINYRYHQLHFLKSRGRSLYVCMFACCLSIIALFLKVLIWSLETHLYLFKRNFEGERFVIIRIECTFLYWCLLLLQSFAVLHQRNLHVRIRETTNVHLLQVFGFQNNYRQLASSWNISQRETDVTKFVVLKN